MLRRCSTAGRTNPVLATPLDRIINGRGGGRWSSLGNSGELGQSLFCAIDSASIASPCRVTGEDDALARLSQSEITWHEQRDKRAKIWFEKLCRFHDRKPPATWHFTPGDVIECLRDHLRRKTPAWKRLSIIQSLICYRRMSRSLRLMT